MKNHNYLYSKEKNEDEEGGRTSWESLRRVPFSGEKDSPYQIRQEIREQIIYMRQSLKLHETSLNMFMQVIFHTLRPLMSRNQLRNLNGDYLFWLDALGELKPFFAEYWAECDPYVIGYLYLMFVAQFIVILTLWKQVGYGKEYEEDCAFMGTNFVDMCAVQSSMLGDIMAKWGLEEAESRGQRYLNNETLSRYS